MATTTTLDRDLADQASPFYGFFTTTRLHPFSIDTAADMLAVIAETEHNPQLAADLRTDEAQCRLRVVEHIADGQPRLWSIFGSALTIDGVDDLVDLLLRSLDDLTPYYQAQLDRLSPRQHLVVSELAIADRPLNVRTIAERIEADERSVAKTISDLAERGWVAPCRSIALQFVDRRRTYYELAEPLAQIAFQLKHTRGGQPLPVVVDFLKSWFTTPDLEQADQTNAYILAAIEPAPQIVRRLHRLPANRLPAVQLWTKIDDALAALAASQPEPLFDLPAPVRSAVEARLSDRLTPLCIAQCRLDVHREVGNDYDDNSHLDLQDWIGRAETLAAEIGATQPEAFANLARWHTRAWQFAAAAEVIAQLRDRFGPDHPLTLACRNGLGHAHLKAGTLDQAIFIFEQNLTDSQRILGPDHPNTLTARNNLASAYLAVGDLGRAIPLYEEALTDSRRVLGPAHPNTLAFRDNLAFAYRAAGDLAHTSPPQSPSAPLSARPPSRCGPSDSP